MSTFPTTRSLPKGPAREDRTRCDILSATLSLVERLGFSKITLDDIARSLGKKKSFLYYYFPDKEAILASAVRREIEAIRSAIQSAVEKESTGKAKISAYLMQYHQEIKRRLPMITHLRQEVQRGSHGNYALILDQSRRLMRSDIPLMAEILREGVRDGSLRPLAPEEIDAMANFTVMALRGIEQEYILGEATESVEQSFNVAIRILERGLAP
ncbi:MAG: TetR/AcrR family transcriptional regulator [Fibrobacterota bacterium]|nr:TetR/AcrR family transcriptional regulator [Fibrobacterota bacterium]QQS07322.1 MAG: TetR/AcrR family transcriptional regulator [Fibrobacterota bacterium]